MGRVVKINKIYKPFFASRNRYCILYGGAGSGKSHVAAQKILIRAITEKNHRFLIVRKVARTLRASVFQMFRDLIAEENISHKFKINKTDMTIECIDSGSTLLFFGLDDVEKLKSIAGVTSIWIEEASEVTKEDFDQLNLRLRSDKKELYMQIILSFNPVNIEHWLKREFFDKSKEDSYIQKTTYLDNRFLPKEYLRVFDDLKESNPTFYKIYALGEWGTLKGLIYNKYEVINEMPKHYETEVFGIDFGYNHPQTYVRCVIDKNNLYIDEIFYESGYENRAFIEWVDKNRPQYKHIQTYADSARADLIEELQKHRFNVKPAKKDVFAGINRVKSFNIHVTKNSTNIIKELNTYSWKEDKNGNNLDEPIKINDDALDAVRYAIFSYFNPIKKLSLKVNI